MKERDERAVWVRMCSIAQGEGEMEIIVKRRCERAWEGREETHGREMEGDGRTNGWEGAGEIRGEKCMCVGVRVCACVCVTMRGVSLIRAGRAAFHAA